MKKIVLIFMSVFVALLSFTTVYAATDFDSNTVYFDANGGEYIHQSTKDLENALEALDPMSLLFVGDSTSNDDNEWVYLTSQYLLANIDDYSISYRVFSNTTQSYSRIDYLQDGAEGDAYALLDGSSGTGIQTPSSDDLEIAGDIDLAVKVAMDNYTAAGSKILVDKLGGIPGQRSYMFNLASGVAKPSFVWSANGTDLITATATVAATVVNAEALWFRVTLDVDNGAGGYDAKFYTSTTGEGWDQLGATVTGGATTSIYQNSEAVTFGSRSLSLDLWSGKFYEAVIRSGIGSTAKVVANPNLGNATANSATFEDVEGNTYTFEGNAEAGYGSPELTILNASVAGETLAYFSDVTRFDKVVTFNPEMTFISLGHNEGLSDDLRIAYNAYVNLVVSNYPDTNIVLVAQNPQVAPSAVDSIAAHAIRQQQVGVIASENKYGYIDAFEALSADPATLIAADGVHPTEAGSIVWKNEAVKFLQGAFTTGVELYHIEVEDSDTITLPDNPVNIGYSFAGWYTNEALTQAFNDEEAIVTSDMTLYAKWTVGSTPIVVPEESAITTTQWIIIGIVVIGIGYIWYKKK